MKVSKWCCDCSLLVCVARLPTGVMNQVTETAAFTGNHAFCIKLDPVGILTVPSHLSQAL